MLTCGFAEMISLAALIPFLKILSEPQQIREISNFPIISFLDSNFNNQQLLILITFLFVLIAIFLLF